MIFTFSTGKTKLAPVLYKLKNVGMCYIIFPNNINHFLAMVEHEIPDYILGMGLYTGIDQDKVRIETMCTNQFRNDFIDSTEKKELSIPYFLEANDDFKFSSGIGNSYCNLFSYNITKFIEDKNLKTKFTFLHVPTSWDAKRIIDKIDQSLINLKSKV